MTLRKGKRVLKKVLIANRAEIASRVIRACKKLNIKSVAVFSDVDAHLPYVSEADEAVYIGPAPAAQSYLVADTIIEAAKESGADAIHPGYGFLSENADFVEQVNQAGLTFIGPSAEAMHQLGSKDAAKQVATKAGVPVTPWFKVENADQAVNKTQEIGYPVIVKPVAGGGGKGMYRCENDDELAEGIERATREAKSAFGDDNLLVEKFLVNPRHIEVQILGDSKGNVVHLFERECSIQRRNQKLIEESPTTALNKEEREKLCEDAVKIAKAVNYENAGTCEFLYDEKGKSWYFCEMNTRLQVEHPVTEVVTGIDIVEQQLRVASGEALPYTQKDVVSCGHAIELRIIAEDPFENFSPSLGTVEHLELPQGEDIRNDAGYTTGNTISPHYDSLLTKLIVGGGTREEAIRTALSALKDFRLVGLQTCIPFHQAMLCDKGFTSGKFHIHYAEERMNDSLCKKEDPELAALAAALVTYKRETQLREAKESDLSSWVSSTFPKI